ncbi:MAG: hypothetical protein JRM96_01035 [Nitrososphaerota archaeon]|nr:hypothetical protein [Nitrososphaerota archaeon]MDG6952019.1 hypothetical protein [Nitrososphaerota archaeon]MDG7004222.1 hypothetical protein [Nitrososphaerota archaeon]MDG7029427.1 hypothetical protein [Nitrososphaerota archaeon]MDG7033253.1 hypothetical protein [Nitrososphaerota archaeon]
MTRQRQRKKLGQLLFFGPIVALIIIVLLGFGSSIAGGSGTLVVRAQGVQQSPGDYLHVSATVSGSSRITPFNLTLRQGTYTVSYAPLEWYRTPHPVSVTVIGGKTAYAVGSYVPTPVGVSIGPGGPNVTSATAEHNVTPIVWINRSTATVQISSPLFSVPIPPGANHTSTFPTPGTVQVQIFPYGGSVSVVVV